jgi:hypothetical protein
MKTPVMARKKVHVVVVIECFMIGVLTRVVVALLFMLPLFSLTFSKHLDTMYCSRQECFREYHFRTQNVSKQCRGMYGTYLSDSKRTPCLDEKKRMIEQWKPTVL